MNAPRSCVDRPLRPGFGGSPVARARGNSQHRGEWIRIGIGYWWHPQLGEITREDGEWWWDEPHGRATKGPFPTLTKAIEAVECNGNAASGPRPR